MDNPIVKKNWLTRILDTFGIKGYGQIIENPQSPERGASWSLNVGIFQHRSPLIDMSVYGKHGYTYACISKASQDIANLPIKLYRKDNVDKVEITEHPILELISNPNSIMDGELFREQFIVDLTMTGNFYCLIVGDLNAPTSLFRLHPQNVKIVPDPVIMIKGYEYSDGGSVAEYPVERIIHIRRASWNNGAQGELYGTGAIEALEQELKGDIGAQRLASETAGKGRPDVLLSPMDPSDIWGKDMRTEIKDAYDKMSSKGGAMVLSGQVKVDTVQLSPRDLEYQSLRTLARENISAVTGTPSTVLGLPDANYATARQANITYWENQKLKSRRLEKFFTKVAKMFDSSLFVEFDFSSIDALQDVRNQQLERIEKHIINGVDAEAAYQFEGLSYPIIEEEPAPIESPVEQNNSKQVSKAKKKISPEIVKGSVGDRNPTNFPEDGDDKEVALRNSQWERFPWKEAQALKDEWPEIWKKGGNILGSLQYSRLKPIAERNSSIAKTETEELAIRLREAWAARHYEDFRLAGVVAQIKWLVVGSRGLAHMRKVIQEEKARLDKKSQKAFRQPDEKDKYWRAYISKVDPLQSEFQKAAQKYLQSASHRYANRTSLLAKVIENKSFETRADYSALLGREIERQAMTEELGTIWSRIWTLIGNESLDDLYTMTKRPKPTGINLSERPIVQNEIESMVENLLDTTEDKIKKIVRQGIRDGLSNENIAIKISEDTVFSESRAKVIAQTETTKATNLATVESYQLFEDEEDIKVYKEWIDSKDDLVREEHIKLGNDEPIPAKDYFQVAGDKAMAPAGFSDVALNVNCRCTIAPVIKD